MKKASIEILLLLSNISSKKEMSDFIREVKLLSVPEIDAILSKLEEHKQVAFQTTAEAIDIELQKRKVEVEKQKEANSTATEIIYLLLTRYKLKVPIAAERLSKELDQKGLSASLTGSATKANFSKWIQQLCVDLPRDKVMSAALNLGS
jgi:hypothetical protein